MDRSWGVPLLVLVLCLSGTVTVGAATAVASADAGVVDATGGPVSGTTEHPAALASASAVAGATRAPPDPGFGAERFDRTEFVIRVAPNGDARWTIRYMRSLANESDEAAFRDFADRFETEETTLYTDFQETASSLVVDGERLVDRPMRAENFSRRASVDENLGQRDTGVVEMSFTWTGFANASGERVVVGDVLEGGLYIDQNQELVVRPTGDLRFDSVDPQAVHSGPTLAESDSVTWQGELSFSDNRPRVVMTTEPVPQDTDTPTATASPTPTDGSPGTTGPTDTGDGTTEVPASGDGGGDGGDGGDATMLLVGGLLVVLAGGAAAAVLRRRGPPDDGDSAAGSPPDSSDGGPGAPTTDGDATAATAAETASPAPGPPGGQAVQEEPLTDEALVIDLLEANDGQMKQSAIVEETGWSKSKVSMVLSEMDDEGDLSKLRVGRENLISLEGHEPAAARSPFEDEE